MRSLFKSRTRRTSFFIEEEAWPPEFKCPISNTGMADPVIVCSGQSYERRCIEAWMRLGETRCYVHSTNLLNTTVISNTALKAAIQSWCNSHGRVLPTPPTPDCAIHLAKALIANKSSKYVEVNSSSSSSPNSVLDVMDSSGRLHSHDVVSSALIVSRYTHLDADNSGKGSSRESGLPGEVLNVFKHGGITDDQGGLTPSTSMGVETISILASCSESSTGETQERASNVYEESSLVKCSRDKVLLNEARSLENHVTPSSSYEGSSLVKRPQDKALLVEVRSLENHVTPSSSHEGSSLVKNPQDKALLIELVSLDNRVTPSSSYEGSSLTTNLKSARPVEQEKALAELRRLTRTDPTSRSRLCSDELLHAMLHLVTSKYSGVQNNAVASLVNISLENENKVPIVRSGIVPCLIEVLQTGYPEARGHAAGALFSLSLNEENRIVIGVLGAIPHLLNVIKSGEEGAKHDAAMALYHLSFASSNRSKMLKGGAVKTLMQFVQNDDNPHGLRSKALMILCSIAASSEGRKSLFDVNAVGTLAEVLEKVKRDTGKDSLEIQEHSVSMLRLLSHQSLRFVSLVMQYGVTELLASISESGSIRARENASKLLQIIEEVASDREECSGSIIPTTYAARLDRSETPSSNSTSFGSLLLEKGLPK